MQTSIHTADANPYRMRLGEAWQGVRSLLRDPEETSHVFTVVRALSGKSVLRGYQRFAATPMGRTILAENRDLIEVLQNRDHLRSLPADSLGRSYLDFMEAQNITAEGLAEASMNGELPQAHDHQLYARRLRDMHDLWHVTTGYGPDTMGEVCLLGFTYGQTCDTGLGFIAIMGAMKIAREQDRRIFQALWAGYRAGRRAAWLPSADWEQLLTRPIDEVRALLKISAPKVYPEMRCAS
jgi:ubiquinone biosynthesis protein COQ4